MIGVVVAAHGHLAEELLRTAEGVVGPLAQSRAVSVAVNGDPRLPLREAIEAVDQGDGVLLLTDLMGGSPTNLCLSFLAERNVEVVTGVNLPMLIKLGPLRQKGSPVIELARELCAVGQKAIVDATDLVRSRRP
jgi:PTS system mannose-specific IIA component